MKKELNYMDIRSSFEALDKKFTAFGGLTGGGITRLLYSKEWSNAVQALKETIMCGAHIDTVVECCHLDGQFCVLAAVVAMQSLKAEYGQPLRSLEILALAEEEGSRFPFAFWGSKNFFNLADKADVDSIADG